MVSILYRVIDYALACIPYLYNPMEFAVIIISSLYLQQGEKLN